MKILVMGAGKMGSFFIDLLSFEHEVAVFERDAKRMRFTYNCQRFTTFEEIQEFKPELLINAVTLKYTIPVFKEVIPYLPKECIISDIASVKTDMKEFYESTGMRYVSTHPMFGPTFANLQQLSEENAIIISEGDYMGRIFFKDLYQKLGLNIYEYTFEEHDKTVAYSLSIPFVSTFVFAAVMKHQDAPGTTFKRHVTGNPVQSLYPRSGRSDPYGAERVTRDHRQQGCRGHERLPYENPKQRQARHRNRAIVFVSFTLGKGRMHL